jgi:hypothetical protein
MVDTVRSVLSPLPDAACYQTHTIAQHSTMLQVSKNVVHAMLGKNVVHAMLGKQLIATGNYKMATARLDSYL